MNKTLRLLAVPTLALGALALSCAPAVAHDGDHTYQAALGQLNGSSAGGNVTLHVTGDQAHVVLNVSGLAATFNNAPYPHVQHIHVGAKGQCPAPSADANGDGVISTTEGAAAYGKIGTTLSTSGDTSPAAGLDLKVAGQGGAYTIDRSFPLNAETKAALHNGTAVVVVHGLDPATLSAAGQAAKSDLVPSLPLAATSPALCGTLTADQMAMPVGGADTGVEQTPQKNDAGVLALGGGLVLAAAAGGTYIVRRRRAADAVYIFRHRFRPLRMPSGPPRQPEYRPATPKNHTSGRDVEGQDAEDDQSNEEPQPHDGVAGRGIAAAVRLRRSRGKHGAG